MKNKFLVPALVAAMALSSQAAVIANYDFAGSSLASSDSELNTTASALSDYSTDNDGAANPATSRNILGSVSASVGNPSPGIAGTFQHFGGGGTPVGSLAEALSENIYIGFTIAPTGGATIDFTNFTIDVQKVAGGAAFYGWLLVDQNNNGWDIGDQIGAEDSFTQIGAWETMSFDASSLTGVSTATSFRIYLGSDGTGASNGINVDNLVMNGTVTPVPEPRAALLGGLGLLALLRRRR